MLLIYEYSAFHSQELIDGCMANFPLERKGLVIDSA